MFFIPFKYFSFRFWIISFVYDIFSVYNVPHTFLRLVPPPIDVPVQICFSRIFIINIRISIFYTEIWSIVSINYFSSRINFVLCSTFDNSIISYCCGNNIRIFFTFKNISIRNSFCFIYCFFYCFFHIFSRQTKLS